MLNHPEMTEQEAFDEWCPESYRNRIWTAQAQEAARAAFAAAWFVRGKTADKYGLALMMISQGCADHVGIADKALRKSWVCKCCGWRGEMPNTKVLPDSMGTAQVLCCPECDQHAALKSQVAR
jgi:hypothetical protein